MGALSFARCEYVVIDMSRNTKSFDFFDVKVRTAQMHTHTHTCANAPHTYTHTPYTQPPLRLWLSPLLQEVRESFAALFHAYLAPLLQEGRARIVLY